jgi:hypothetical protein
VKLTLAGCPKRTILSLRTADQRISQHKIWHTETRRRSGTYEVPRALAVSGRSTAYD